jgi:23S rRNA G2445 N2-methylase RlmL
MVFPGLEPIAEEEISRDLKSELKRTSTGIVVFRPPEIDGSLLRLRTVEDVFLLAWGTDQLSQRSSDLDKVRRWTERGADWNQLLRLHHAIRPRPQGKPSFRLVAQMTGTHGYRRADARKALAEGLMGKLPQSWRHVEENADVEVWLTINGPTAVCGVRLSDSTMRHRSYKKEHVPASLRPTVAAAMARLANLTQGATVLDPMCGAGTVLAEVLELARQRSVRLANVMGGDVDPGALRAAAQNLRRLGPIKLARWQAQMLPVANNSVNRLLCNPPFGKKLGKPEDMRTLYQDLVTEFQRVLQPAGRAVLLVSDFQALKSAACQAGWSLIRQLRIRILGQVAFLSVWRGA